MSNIVISQPMFFPWIGLFEQIRLADVFVHYDDVQLPIGRSFMSRVQIKTHSGVKWLTVPIKRQGTQLIKDVILDESQNWREMHIKTLQHNYARCPFFLDMLDIVQQTYDLKTSYLAELNIYAIEKISKYFDLEIRFCRSSNFSVQSSSSRKLFEIVCLLDGTTYITGHGARNYLDHDLFERNSIQVEYMDYKKIPYPQNHAEFTPFVSILDLIANVGQEGRSIIASETINWKEFCHE